MTMSNLLQNMSNLFYYATRYILMHIKSEYYLKLLQIVSLILQCLGNCLLSEDIR